MLKIKERENGKIAILDLEGDVIMGGGSAKLREAAEELLRKGKHDILLNFGRVKYIDSSGTGELVSILNFLNEKEGNLKLCALNSKVEEVLALSSLLPILDTYETEAEALKSA